MRHALFVALAGCSFVATEAPRPPPGATACNREMKPVVADAIAGAGAVLASTIASVEHARGADLVVPISLAGVFGASAAYGTIEVRRCRAEHAKRPGWFLADMPVVM